MTSIPGEDSDPLDEATIISGRHAPAAEPGPTEHAGDGAAEEPAPGPRRAHTGEADEFEPLEDDGSTVVARRESRRRQQRAVAADAAGQPPYDESDADGETAPVGRAGRSRGLAATLAADVPAPLGRVARTPETTPAASPMRTAAPVVVPRAAAVAHEPQELVDTAADESARRARSRRVTAIVIIAASLLAVCAAAALFVLVATT